MTALALIRAFDAADALMTAFSRGTAHSDFIYGR